MKILDLTKIDTFYDDSHILFDVDLSVNKGSITGILGRNGAGKTTLLKTIMGLVKPKNGKIMLKDADISGLPAYRVAKAGIGYVPDDRQIFAPLTVYENLIIGVRKNAGPGSATWTLEKIYDLFPILHEFVHKRGQKMSGGEQKMLAIARALMTNPEILLLDEPTEGLAPLVVSHLCDAVKKISNRGVTVLIADQNLRFAKRIIDYGYILDKGYIQHQAPMECIWEDQELVCQYLAV